MARNEIVSAAHEKVKRTAAAAAAAARAKKLRVHFRRPASWPRSESLATKAARFKVSRTRAHARFHVRALCTTTRSP